MKRMHNMEFKSRIIKVDLRHSRIANRSWPEIRIDNCITIGELKEKLYSNCGTPPSNMALYAYDQNNVKESQVFLDNDELQLHMYGVKDGHVIYINELNQRNEDVSVKSKYTTLIANLSNSPLKDSNSKLHQHYIEQLERCQEANNDDEFQHYRMSDEDYEERGRDLRNFIAQMRVKAGIIPAEGGVPKPEGKSIDELKHLYPIESRCSVTPGDIRGTVKFVGLIKNKARIGVDLDEPLGQNDGSVDGIRCFVAKGERYGAFYDIEQVVVGDFPELDPFDIA